MKIILITFASTNQSKYNEVRSILLNRHGIAVDFFQAELIEIQSDSLEDIAKEKAKSAFVKKLGGRAEEEEEEEEKRMNKPVIVEDDGLFIEALNGFPGQYSSHVFKTIGNAGILKLLEDLDNRSAFFRSLIAYYDGKDLLIFEGKVDGKIISDKKITTGVCGNSSASAGGWGYDPIFIPDGTDLTFAQLGDKKNEYSHRKAALEKFANWYLKL